MLDVETAMRHRNNDLLDKDGQTVGRVKEIYVDDRTGEPAWALVTLGVLGTTSHFVPIEDAEVDGEHLKVAFTKDQVEQAPAIEDDQHLDADEERALYHHYGLDYDGATGPAPAEEPVESAPAAGGRLRKQVVADAPAAQAATPPAPEPPTAPEPAAPEPDTVEVDATVQVDAPLTDTAPPAAPPAAPAPQPITAAAHVAASTRAEPPLSTLHERGQPAERHEGASSLPVGALAAAGAGASAVAVLAVLRRQRRAAAPLARARSAGRSVAPVASLLLLVVLLKRLVSRPARRNRGPRARDIMTGGADCVLESDTLEQAARRMATLDVGALPICGADGRLKGMLTDRDIVVKAVAAQRDPALVTVTELAQGKPVTVAADASVEEVLRTMSRHKVRRLPVIDRYQLVGVISQADLAVHLDADRIGQLVEAISSAP